MTEVTLIHSQLLRYDYSWTFELNTFLDLISQLNEFDICGCWIYLLEETAIFYDIRVKASHYLRLSQICEVLNPVFVIKIVHQSQKSLSLN